ncbi:MAG: type ISP restriction/modification enzyme [Nitrosospira sp.]
MRESQALVKPIFINTESNPLNKPNYFGVFLSAACSVQLSGAGTKETSYYTALNNLLNGIGSTLKPKVSCIMQLKNLGVGNPDGGLFTQEQFDRVTGNAKDLSTPARGVLEVKAPNEEVNDICVTEQINKYWNRYKLVLVTNLRDWLLIGVRDGQRVSLERYTLAASETEFWMLAAHPQQAEAEHGDSFVDFLCRVLRHNAPLSDPKDLAWLLASYAREARHRVERAVTINSQATKQIEALKNSLEVALGVAFTEEEGAHFFRSTLVQTLFYGMFAAWVLRHEQSISARFEWRAAAYDLHVPMITTLFEQLSQPSKLKALNLTEVLDWTADALNRVDKAAFFSKFEGTHSVQYFYEPFLKAFDPQLRKQLGVWYTPEEIVRYQVARVDEALQTELGLQDGLADPNVVVLDPCCGTGAYLVEVLRVVGERLAAQGSGALAAHELKQAATSRLFGFELLPAPYVIAHLQLGLLLRKLGAPLGMNANGKDERAGIYLTNALTGWEPPKAPKTQVLPFSDFAEEQDAADQIKRSQKILVILGNPPYNAFTGVALGEEQQLVAPYKVGLFKKWGIKKFNLDELYVRFFRLAERRIAEQGDRGIVSFISNYSWTSEASFVVLRERLLNNFDKFWIDNMHGNRKISEYAPDGRTSESVFAQRGFSPGIQQGVVISLWVKTGKTSLDQAQVVYRDSFHHAKADERRRALIDSLNDQSRSDHYTLATPTAANKFSFRPSVVGIAYANWPNLPSLAGHPPINGLMEKRGGALIDMDKDRLRCRMTAYLDNAVSAISIAELHAGLATNAARFDAVKTRQKLLKIEQFNQARLKRYAVRPFDTRWCYYSPNRPLWNEPRPKFWEQHQSANAYLLLRPTAIANPEGVPFMFTRILGDNDFLRGHAYYIPFHWHRAKESSANINLFEFDNVTGIAESNLSVGARAYLSTLGFSNTDTDRDTSELIWLHALAIGYSPAYLTANADGIRQDWPRIPLPTSRMALEASAALGHKVAALLDTESPVDGVTNGKLYPELNDIAVLTRVSGGSLKAEEFALTAGWGHRGKDGIIKPGRGKIETSMNVECELNACLGETRYDIYLNANAYWKNVPKPVWDFIIGGYQVMKKWLSYREQSLLGRTLTLNELKEVSAIARRLTALVLLQSELNKNYLDIASATYPYPSAETNDEALIN